MVRQRPAERTAQFFEIPCSCGIPAFPRLSLCLLVGKTSIDAVGQIFPLPILPGDLIGHEAPPCRLSILTH